MTTLPYPKIGDHVKVIEKPNYGSGELTDGYVKEILTSTHNHPRGTKVRLESGIVGRIQAFVKIGENENITNVSQLNPTSSEQSEKNEVIYETDPEALV